MDETTYSVSVFAEAAEYPMEREPWDGAPLDPERGLLAARWLRERSLEALVEPPVEPGLLGRGPRRIELRKRIARAGMDRALRSAPVVPPQKALAVPRFTAPSLPPTLLPALARAGAKMRVTIRAVNDGSRKALVATSHAASVRAARWKVATKAASSSAARAATEHAASSRTRLARGVTSTASAFAREATSAGSVFARGATSAGRSLGRGAQSAGTAFASGVMSAGAALAHGSRSAGIGLTHGAKSAWRAFDEVTTSLGDAAIEGLVRAARLTRALLLWIARVVWLCVSVPPRFIARAIVSGARNTSAALVRWQTATVASITGARRAIVSAPARSVVAVRARTPSVGSVTRQGTAALAYAGRLVFAGVFVVLLIVVVVAAVLLSAAMVGGDLGITH